MLAVINFHYFRETKKNQGIFPLSSKEFEHQLDTLSKCFRFVSLRDIMESDRMEVPSCLLTFDDGLREQYDVAFNILNRKGIPGAFFVCPVVYTDKKVMDVHMLHHIMESMDKASLNTEVCSFIKEEGIQLPQDIKEIAKRQYRYDDSEMAELKAIMNFVLDMKSKQKLVTALFNKLECNTDQFIRSLYMSISQIKELNRRGFLGSHSYDHYPLGALPDEEAMGQLRRSRDFFMGLSHEAVVAISYPYGGPDAVTRRTAEIAEELGFKIGLTMERAVNKTLSDKMLLARFDTNDVPAGKRPLFSGIEDVFASGLFRKRYIHEETDLRHLL